MNWLRKYNRIEIKDRSWEIWSAIQWVSSGPSSSRCQVGIMHNIYWGRFLQRIQGRFRHRRGESSDYDAGLTPVKWKERQENWVREHVTECRSENALTRPMWVPSAKIDYWLLGESTLGRNSPAKVVLPDQLLPGRSLREAQLWCAPMGGPVGAASSGSGSVCSLQQVLLKVELSWAEHACPWLTHLMCWCFPPSLFSCSEVFGEEIRILN